MTSAKMNSPSSIYIIDAARAEDAVKLVINTLRGDVKSNALSTLKEVRQNVFTYSGGENDLYDYVYKSYVECFFGEFKVTTVFISNEK